MQNPAGCVSHVAVSIAAAFLALTVACATPPISAGGAQTPGPASPTVATSTPYIFIPPTRELSFEPTGPMFTCGQEPGFAPATPGVLAPNQCPYNLAAAALEPTPSTAAPAPSGVRHAPWGWRTAIAALCAGTLVAMSACGIYLWRRSRRSYGR